MPTYAFHCDKNHPDRDFLKTYHGYPSHVIKQTKCKCGATAKRDLSKEIPTQSIVGQTPIRPSDSKFSMGKETEYAFGKFFRRKDGKVDKNHAPFSNTGELDRFMNGANDLGAPVIGDNGEPIRVGAKNAKTGEVHNVGRIKERRGAKLFKYDKNAQPPTPPPIRRSGMAGEWSSDPGEGFIGGADSRTIYKR